MTVFSRTFVGSFPEALIRCPLASHRQEPVKFIWIDSRLQASIGSFFIDGESVIYGMKRLLMVFQYVVGHKRFETKYALVPSLSSMPDLMSCPVLGQGKDLVAVVARICSSPRVNVRMPSEAGQSHITTLAHDATVEHLPVHKFHHVLLIWEGTPSAGKLTNSIFWY